MMPTQAEICRGRVAVGIRFPNCCLKRQLGNDALGLFTYLFHLGSGEYFASLDALGDERLNVRLGCPIRGC